MYKAKVKVQLRSQRVLFYVEKTQKEKELKIEALDSTI